MKRRSRNDSAVNSSGTANRSIDVKPVGGKTPKKKITKKVQQKDSPPAELDQEKKEYEVEDVVGHKLVRGISFYKIRWKGYSAQDDTWETEDSLSCQDLIDNFQSKELDSGKKPSKESRNKGDNIEGKKSTERDENSVQGRTTNRKRFAHLEDKKSALESDDEPIAFKKNKKQKDASQLNKDTANLSKIYKEYEVESVVGHKLLQGISHYRIRWKGYDASGDTWESEDALSCQELIDNFHNKGHKPGSNTSSKDKQSISLKNGNAKVKGKNDASKKISDEDKEEEFEVEAIVGHKVSQGITYYLVRWKGFEADADTWEMKDSLSCQSLINDFHKKKKDICKKTLLHLKKPKSPLNSDEDKTDKEWEVEKILAYGVENKERVFRIRWKGYTSKEDTWEPEKNLNCKDLIDEFMENIEKTKNIPNKNLRDRPKKTKRLVDEVPSNVHSRKSGRNGNRSRTFYFDDYSE